MINLYALILCNFFRLIYGKTICCQSVSDSVREFKRPHFVSFELFAFCMHIEFRRFVDSLIGLVFYSLESGSDNEFFFSFRCSCALFSRFYLKCVALVVIWLFIRCSEHLNIWLLFSCKSSAFLFTLFQSFFFAFICFLFDWNLWGCFVHIQFLFSSVQPRLIGTWIVWNLS